MSEIVGRSVHGIGKCSLRGCSGIFCTYNSRSTLRNREDPVKRVLMSSTAVLVIALGAGLVVGQGGGNPFVDRSDKGETLHVLPTPASIRSPFDTQPTIAPRVPGLSVYGPSYGSGNLVYHSGGAEIAGAGFFAVYWNNKVSDVGGPGVTSLGYSNIQSQLSAFTASFADGM